MVALIRQNKYYYFTIVVDLKRQHDQMRQEREQSRVRKILYFEVTNVGSW